MAINLILLESLSPLKWHQKCLFVVEHVGCTNIKLAKSSLAMPNSFFCYLLDWMIEVCRNYLFIEQTGTSVGCGRTCSLAPPHAGQHLGHTLLRDGLILRPAFVTSQSVWLCCLQNKPFAISSEDLASCSWTQPTTAFPHNKEIIDQTQISLLSVLSLDV